MTTSGYDRDHRVVRREDRRFGSEPPPSARPPTWRAYLSITLLLVLLVVGIVGGVIWFSAQKSSELMLAASERLTTETAGRIIERLRLIYDPIYVIVGLGAEVSDLTSQPATGDTPSAIYRGLPLMLRGLTFYPQILSLYVGFENGDFFMVTHLAGDRGKQLHDELGAPPQAVFANEIITSSAVGERTVRWFFLAQDGSVVGNKAPAPADFDPRPRPWYRSSRDNDMVERSAMYIFASSGEPGFTLSRRFGTPMKGVIGADLAASDISHFLREQRVTPSSTAIIFTTGGNIVAVPDTERMRQMTKSAKPDATIALPKIDALGDPLLSGFFTHYKSPGTELYDIDGQSYVGQVTPIPPRYGQDQFLAVLVPLEEIERPITDYRNEMLFRSIVLVLLVLPLFSTLVVAWIDRRLERSGAGLRETDYEA